MADRDRQERNVNEIIRERIELIERELAAARLVGNTTRERELAEEKILEATKLRSDFYDTLDDEQKKMLDNIKKQNIGEKKINDSLYARKNLMTKILSINKQIFDYLMLNDKVIRQTALNLGLSGQKADYLRLSFEQSATFAARLGGSMQDLQTITEGYADATGRARVLSSETLNDIIMMGRGTALGVENAARLAGQFEIIGISASQSMQYVQGVVETSERMGVNTARVLRNINDNFKRLQTFAFQQGVKGFAEMAMYSEKMRIDMGQALDAAETARNLENAIGLAAQLQVMGGEFAKTDPFQLLFLARNDPAEFTKKINEMTKSVVTFRRMADGSFEKYISPADRDRLFAVEKALGMQTGQLVEQAHRMADIQRMRQQMIGAGLSAAEREMIEGIAEFNNQTGKFQTRLGNVVFDINRLNSDFIRTLHSQEASLEKRAMEAQTFDDAFKATVEELKAAFLPILKGINQVLTTVRPIVVSVSEAVARLTQSDFGRVVLQGAGILMVATLAFGGVVKMLGGIVGMFKMTMKAFTAKKAAETIASEAPTLSPTQTLAKGKAAGHAGRGAMMKGAGVGAAGLGIGVGVGAAAMGISQLADSMKELNVEQLASLERILFGIGIALPVFAGGLLLAGLAGTKASIGLGAIGLAALALGGAIGIATAGIGYMAKNLGDMIVKTQDSGPAMKELASGIGSIATSMVGFAVGGAGLAGMMIFSRLMSNITKHSPSLKMVGDAFKEINAVMSANAEDFERFERMIASISEMNIKDGSLFSELKELMSKPLRVQFDDTNVNLVSNITMELDGAVIMKKTFKQVAPLQEEARGGS